VTRDDEGSPLALVIAGLDPKSSTRALMWGRTHGVAIIALAPPDSPDATGDFGFIVGADRQASLDPLLHAAPALAGAPVAPVIDESEVEQGPSAQAHGMNLLPPISCDAPIRRAGEPRFPLASWREQRVRGWLVSGSGPCAQDLLDELGGARSFSDRPVVALSLEASGRPRHPAGVRVVAASAGFVPSEAARSADDEVRRFGSVLGDGHVKYWTAIGRDAATLARVALRKLPGDTVTEPRRVTERRALVRTELASARAPLWSTESAGWSDLPGGGHTIKRTVCAVDVPASR
jgi:hypothetical protein